MTTTQKHLAMKTPEKSGIRVPSGHVLINPKWRKEVLGKELAKRINITYSDALGLVDFFVSEEHPVLYLSESDLLTQKKICKEKISKLNSMYGGKGTVILTRNSKTLAEFNDLQEYTVLDLGMFVFPISCQSEVPTIVHKMVMAELKSPARSRKFTNSNLKLSDQIAVLTKIPGIGNEKAKLLLDTFGNITCISEANSDSLVCTIGDRAGKSVFNFFNQPI